MAHNKSKAKGSAYEQKIATLLTSEFKKEFRRVPLSGSIDYLKVIYGHHMTLLGGPMP